MNGYRFGKRSVANMKGVHPALVGICYRALALSADDFGITEGLRSADRQARLLDEGKSTTMHSYHLTGAAVDFAVFINGKLTWDFEYYKEVARAFKQAASEYGLKITWGGDWRTFVDGPHIQLEP